MLLTSRRDGCRTLYVPVRWFRGLSENSLLSCTSPWESTLEYSDITKRHLRASGIKLSTTWCAAVQLQKVLASVASRAAAKEFFYTRFFAIGVFRLLELTDTRDPKALEGVVKVRM